MSSVTHGLRRRLLLPAWQAGVVLTAAGAVERVPTELLEGADDQVPVCRAVQDRDGTPVVEQPSERISISRAP